MKILIFSPHQFINVHAIPESLVGNELKLNGHYIYQVGCDGAYENHCISMSAAGIWPTDSTDSKKKVCRDCKNNRDALNRKFKFNNNLLESYIKKEDEKYIVDILTTVNVNNWTNFEIDGIRIGRYASYEFLLNYKINSIILTNEQWGIYLGYLKNSLKTFFAGKRIMQQIKPDRLIVYNNFYSVNHIMCAIAEKFGIPSFSLHAGNHLANRFSQMTIFRGHLSQCLLNRHPGWKIYKEVSMNEVELRSVISHVESLISATSPHVYSEKFSGIDSASLKKFFGIHEGQKVLLVTMASADERFAADLADGLPHVPKPYFTNQIEWLCCLIDWIKNEPNLFLIIRVHPREFPNKREGVASEQGKTLLKIFENMPNNVAINWPTDLISLYDLIRITNVGLNATSTAGLELLMFGLPVIIYDKHQLFAYPPDLNICAENREDYFKSIKSAIVSRPNLKLICGAYKWIAFKSEIVGIDISDGFKAKKWNFFNARLNHIRKLLKISNPLIGLRKYKQLRNHALITYAIERDEESHISYLMNMRDNSQNDDQINEVEFIKKNVLKMAKKIAPNDQEFISKIESLGI